jgi:hypothetical protein
VDPEAAEALRKATVTDLVWEREVAAHGAEFATRPLPPAAIAGYVLAAAAYHSADPFADPAVQAALAEAAKGPGGEARVLMVAMRALRPENQAYAVTPIGARAVLAHADAVAKPDSEFTATLAGFAWWAGDDAATSKALDALKADSSATAAHWRTVARLWAAVGHPAVAQALLDAAHGDGRDKVLTEVAIGDAWIRAGDTARARASAHAILSDGSDDPVAWIAAPQLLDRAGAHEEAVSSAQALGAGAEAGDPATRSAALAAASEALAGVGESAEACRLARRSLATANDSAAAQVATWKKRYGATQIPLNIWLGVDYSGDPIPVEDVRAAFREQATAALDNCGDAAEAAKARKGDRADAAWRGIVPVSDASLSPAERLKTAAALSAGTPQTAARLADAAAQAPEPEDPVARLMWRDALAYAQAAAGRPDQARAASALAVRGLDELTNPDDQQAAGLVLARDHLALDGLTSGQARFGRRLSQ